MIELPAQREDCILPRLIVVYDDGAASFTEIIGSAAQLARLTFVVSERLQASPLIIAFNDVAELVPYSGVVETTSELQRTGPYDGITTFSERMLPVTCALATRLNLPFHDAAAVSRLTDKAEQRRALRDGGVEMIRTASIFPGDDIGPALQAVGIPAVLKPARGEGSRATYLIENQSHAAVFLRQARTALGNEARMQLEEMLLGRDTWPFGDYVSVESIIDGEYIAHLAITGKFALVAPFREVGQFWPASILPGEARKIENITSAALRAIGVRSGITHTEIKLTPSGPRIIEINGRLGGFIDDLARRSMGSSLIPLACAIALGRPYQKSDYQMGADVTYNFSNLPPLEAAELLSADRGGALSWSPGMRRRILIRSGSKLSGGVGAQELDLISGRAQTHAEMFDALREATRRMMFIFRDSGGATLRVAGSELPSAGSLVTDTA